MCSIISRWVIDKGAFEMVGVWNTVGTFVATRLHHIKRSETKILAHNFCYNTFHPSSFSSFLPSFDFLTHVHLWRLCFALLCNQPINSHKQSHKMVLSAGSHGSQVPYPTHFNKSQHGGKVPSIEPWDTIQICLIIIKSISWLLYAKIIARLVLRVWL